MVENLVADKYEVLEEVGRGSLGIVYKARNKQDGRIVALKVIPGVSDDDVKLKRWEQGITSARLLNHPNVVVIHDSGTTEDNRPYYVTDFIEGQLLSDLLKESKRMTVQRAVPIIAQICEAIDHAHYYGVIHRNLKPTNIIITQTAQGERAHVLDFGLAKSFFQTNKPDHRLTAAGEIVGSPEYSSPEQCMFKEMDWRSDIYSTGCLMYHMLAGKPPIKGTSNLDTVVKQVREPAPDLIEAAPDAAIPPAVRDVVMHALQKDPNDRPQTMILLRDELVAAAMGAR